MKKQQKICICIIFIVAFLIFLFNIFSIDNSIDIYNYIYLLSAFAICGSLILFNIVKKEYYIFEPYTIVVILYIIIMIIRPMIDILNQEYYLHGEYVFDGCIKGTIIFVLSFIAFNIGYYTKFSKLNKINLEVEKKNKRKNKISEYKIEYTPKVRRICICLWILGFCFALFFYFSSGTNPIRALSLGLVGSEQTINSLDSSMKFLMKLAFIMIIPWIYIMKFDKNKILKIIITLLMFLHFFAMGSRYILIVTIVGILILPYITKLKSFSLKKSFLLFCVLLVGAGIIAFNRGTIRNGGELSISEFTIDNVFAVFDSDFTIYKAYYCVVSGIPKLMSYQYGKGIILYSLTSFIPSIVFPYKRLFDNVETIIATVVNERAALSGIAYINLGQFYAEFGVIGCIIFMWIFGIICKKIKKLYNSTNTNLNNLILYSVLFPFIMQIIIRGDLAQQLNSLVGIIIPYFILKITKGGINDNAKKKNNSCTSV